MKINLRQLYTPIQPTVRPSGGNVTYQEFLPHIKLQPFIYCYWQLKTTHPLQHPFNYRVVADGCIDIFFEFNDPSENFVMGFCRKYTEFPLDTPFNYVGIRFLPTVFPQFYGIDASEISNRFEHLSVVVPETSEFLGIQLNPSQTMEQIRRVLDDYFLNSLAKAAPSDDNRLYKALHTILENQGDLNVETDIDAGISPRQLRRIFKYYIGDTAKTFSKVVQFQNILRAKPSGQSLKGNKLFYDVGYYDQSHFIKDFKKFYGVTPSRAFAR